MKNQKWFDNRKTLITVAKEQLSNFSYDVVIERQCDVAARTKEDNEKYARMICNNVISNITEYLKKHGRS